MIDYINTYLFDLVDFVIDDQIQKQGQFIPGCKKQILSLSGAFEKLDSKKVGGILLGTYIENEQKVLSNLAKYANLQDIEIFKIYLPDRF